MKKSFVTIIFLSTCLFIHAQKEDLSVGNSWMYNGGMTNALYNHIHGYDLPDWVTALSPMKICMVNPVNALDKLVDHTVFEQVYTNAKKSPNFVAVINEKDVFLLLNQWLDR